MSQKRLNKQEYSRDEIMKNLSVIIFIILTSLLACKDDCLTCPDNEAVVNGECQCIGIQFIGNCMSKREAFQKKIPRGISVEMQPYYSESMDCNAHFDFNNQPLFIYLSEITEYDK